jgi:hypothetical protein
MKYLLRGVFVLLLLLAIWERVVWYRLGHASPDTTAALVVRVQQMGLRVDRVEVDSPGANGIIHAVSEGCPFPIILGRLNRVGQEDAGFWPLQMPDTQVRYVYLGTVGARPDRLEFFWRFLAANSAAVLGLRDARPMQNVVVAVLPQACPQLANLNWVSLAPWS